MGVEKKTIRSDIPGSHVFLNANVGYVGSPTTEASRLVVGRDITLQGQINACDYLIIEGIVQAEAFNSRRMDILESGLFCGAANLQDCVIAGRFEGKLTVSGRLTVKSTGQIYGEVDYGTLEVETGARIDGRMVSIEVPAAVAAPVLLNSNVKTLYASEDADEQKEITGQSTTYRRAAGSK